jgi:hypothetical protein
MLKTDAGARGFNGGFGMAIDGSEYANRRLYSMLF